MKTYILISLLLLTGTYALAQQQQPDRLTLFKAKRMLNINSTTYNPDSAFKAFNKLAKQGNGEAMNTLGMMYMQGLGTVQNDSAALHWFKKAAFAGYGKAFYNVGSMYKAGIGTPQNFEKAYEIFSKGAVLNIGACLYAQGYMCYKGFGVQQNYEQAVELFKKGAKVRNTASWYMLGLCYRNGYGIAQNTDSARYYLTKAAMNRDTRATDELKNLSPENTNMTIVEPPQPPTRLVAPVKLREGFKKTKQNLAKNTVFEGEYNGYILKFDWSGKHIISQSRLRLNLEQRNKQLIGQWEEEGQEPVYLNAKITDTALIFNNTEQAQTDHYHRDKKLLVQFKKGYLKIMQSTDTLYLSGNIEVYSPNAKEPEKPRLIMLVRTGEVGNSVTQSTDLTTVENTAEEDKLDELALHFMAYPNPFANSTNLKYTLRRPAMVSVLITDALTGKTVYRSQQGLQQPGQYNLPLTLHAKPGNYVVTLQYNNKLKSLMVIKN